MHCFFKNYPVLQVSDCSLIISQFYNTWAIKCPRGIPQSEALCKKRWRVEVTLDQTPQETWEQLGCPVNMAELHIHTVINKGLTMNVALLRFKILSSNTAVILWAVCVLWMLPAREVPRGRCMWHCLFRWEPCQKKSNRGGCRWVQDSDISWGLGTKMNPHRPAFLIYLSQLKYAVCIACLRCCAHGLIANGTQ